MVEARSPGRGEVLRPRVSLVDALPEDLPEGSEAPVELHLLDQSELAEAKRARTELSERLAEAEMRLRERDEQEQLRHGELLALERDLAVKEAYVARLEFEHQLVKTEIGQVRDRAAELFGDLERAEARIVELGALAAEIQSQTSYRVAVALTARLRRAGPLFAVLRGGLIALVGRTHQP